EEEGGGGAGPGKSGQPVVVVAETGLNAASRLVTMPKGNRRVIKVPASAGRKSVGGGGQASSTEDAGDALAAGRKGNQRREGPEGAGQNLGSKGRRDQAQTSEVVGNEAAAPGVVKTGGSLRPRAKRKRSDKASEFGVVPESLPFNAVLPWD
ncbi:hypothetical protein HK097_000166, partial [Rhizophlyctis rosea]